MVVYMVVVLYIYNIYLEERTEGLYALVGLLR